MEKRDKLKAKIDKNAAEMQPIYDAYNKLDSEINSELTELEQRKKNAVYDHVMSVFGESLSAEEFAIKFDRIMKDDRNKGLIEQLKREQLAHEKAYEPKTDIKEAS